MKWLTNTYDPEREDARWSLAVQIDQDRETAWRAHLAWLETCTIGQPKATAHETVESLIAKGYIGVYKIAVGGK